MSNFSQVHKSSISESDVPTFFGFAVKVLSHGSVFGLIELRVSAQHTHHVQVR